MANMLALIATITISNSTFCSDWSPHTPKEKLEFLLGPEPRLLADMKKKGVPDGNIAMFKVCFEKNISTILERLDQDCRTEQALTTFFGVQVDTSSQEYEHLTDFINLCVTPDGQTL